jgi:sodium transport system permease protein
MWMRILNIWRKELMDNLRDRKGITQAILIPLLIGIFYAVFNPLMNSALTSRAQEPVKLPALGIDNAGQSFLDALKQYEITLTPFAGDESAARAAIQRGEKPAVLVIPAGFGGDVQGEKPAALTLLTNSTSGGMFGGSFSATRLQLAISAFNRQEAARRVTTRKVDPALLLPIDLKSTDLATPEQEAGAFAAFSLPILLALIVAQGGLYIAIDVTAGEKERGTLESLLATPASDLEVLLGKLSAVFSLSCIPLVLTFLGFWIAGNLLQSTGTAGAAVSFNVIVGAILMGLPLALFISVVLLAVSVRTKAFKDAQSASTPIVLGLMVPAMAAAFVPAKAALAYLIPVYGPSAAIGVMSLGGTVSAEALLLSIASSLLAAAVSFVVALRLFNRERMLYGA